MRYLVYGAGGIGSTVGGRLFSSGRDVVLVSRGPHYEAVARHGLRLATPEGEWTIGVPVVRTIAEAEPRPGDVVVLAMKSQDTEAALEALAERADRATPIFCLQNGVENERRALRRFDNVYAVCVVMPATYLEAGHVDVHAAPVWGILDIGRYPAGVDDCCRAVAGDLEVAGFSSRPVADVLRWKYAKLLVNLGNVLESACGREALDSEFGRRVRQEGTACLDAAGIDVVSDDEDRERRAALTRGPIAGRPRGGSSTWQSLVRGTGSSEADYLNGEITLLGRLHGIPTPANAVLQTIGRRMAREHMSPHSLTLESLVAALDGADEARSGA